MTEQKSSTARTILVIAAIAAFAAVGVTALLVNIMEHKQEARNPFGRVHHTPLASAAWYADRPRPSSRRRRAA